MNDHERQRAILDWLARKPKLGVLEIVGRLKASPATVRRDLRRLEARGELVRTHGGVMHPHYLAGEPSFEQRQQRAADAKAAIADRAAREVPDQATVFVDGGSTTLALGQRLLAREDLTIVTHSVPLVHAARVKKARVLGIGGELREISGVLVGALPLAWLANLRFDVAFLGASGLSREDGASTTELSEAAVKQAVMARAGRSVLLCDIGKWERPAAVRFAAWKDFDAWITDRLPPAAERRAIAARGFSVIAASA
jgi:DeoR/GlpR family transcriptional regulator of sugar metabolism